MAERGHDVTLVDLSGGQLAVARERIRERGLESSVTLCQGSITDLGLAADAFDATCCLGGRFHTCCRNRTVNGPSANFDA